MPQKAFGARFELTLQNPDLEHLLLAYEVIFDFAKGMIGLFNMLKAVWQCGLVPQELLRFSPLQAIATDVVCLFPRMYTESIANYFYLLLDHVVRGKLAIH
jgi:hypothetical protein